MSQTMTATSNPTHTSTAPSVLELRTLGGADPSPPDHNVVSTSLQEQGLVSSASQDVGGSAPPPDAQSVVERWNYPRDNIGKMAFAFVSFIVAGMNDGAIGPLLPYVSRREPFLGGNGANLGVQLEDYYGLGKTVISLIFLTPFIGYSVAAFTNARIHVRFGQRGIAIMAPLCHLITFAVLASHPPYPALVVANAISGFGNGLTDACFCAWVGAMDKANTIQGFLHACYSLGALFSPLIATSMVVQAQLPWFNFYYILVGMSAIELCGLSYFFWDKTGSVYEAEHKRENPDATGAGTREAIRSPVTWLCALFFFAYMGVEGIYSTLGSQDSIMLTTTTVGLGGWVVTFMLNVRHASAYASGISATGFWTGMALGRATLGFVTERFGERLCLTIYLATCLALELLFWLVPEFIVSAVAVAFLGFFLGPMFPGAVMVTTKLLPKRIHVSAIGFAMSMGGTGSAVFPFIIGAVASKKGAAVLQPIILALIAVITLVWLSFPRIKKRD
ncbi:Major facilitator superfamily transporter [Cordyceps militaris CM01]|uniref:Major facilitator superfamily transporter n=1 Tax=Cordyceps militaris (strain CM01) TaxID=983644 RepID=G3J3I0_CORMM|nr:Major facilitator superfamily transporter [Cordyceps militaris CM01]EGX96508.1 Major facilitator superfamily transporter [Cordyceps militaris CM01]